MQLTLAICTYNRSALLSRALQSLCACTPPAHDWELLLIDNNSRDGTRAISESYAGRLPLRYVFEPEQGLSFSRNRALVEFRSDVILFTDDDLCFDTQWLVNFEQVFSEQFDMGWFGGRVQPLWDNGPPHWLRDENMALISGLLVKYDLGERDRIYQATDPTPYGASFAIRRPVYERAGTFRTDLGVRGTVPGRGEEAEYFHRLQREKIPGYYVGRSSAWHHQDPGRFRLGYLYRYGIQKGIAAARMAGARDIGLTRSVSRELEFGLKAIWQSGKGRGDRARQCVINMGIQNGLRRERMRSATC